MGRDSSVQGGILLAAGALDSQARTELAEGSSAEGNTDHVSLRFIQSNLQRSKLATSELLVEADRRRIAVALVQEPYVGSIGELRRYPGCRVVQKATPRRGPVKAAIIVLDKPTTSHGPSDILVIWAESQKRRETPINLIPRLFMLLTSCINISVPLSLISTLP
ncbi:hypothetical protein EVAR_11054_1 [Eumeta japonica]|uniref:Uncharacterized protein n=1 Tax=Eumeta variegata TaxID=151549 RepID=A0A4C1U3Q7_EUMVA|nr:hypothetical protein EVAR_11054_1 [Eumeta japonica]